MHMQVPPILLPVQLTLVPEKVATFNDVTNALRHCVQVRWGWVGFVGWLGLVDRSLRVESGRRLLAY